MEPLSDHFILRTIVDLPEAERSQLDALCRQRGISRAQALREALSQWLEQQQQPQHGEVFGLWRDRRETSLDLQEALRQDWAGRNVRDFPLELVGVLHPLDPGRVVDTQASIDD
jgi:hypothetical protein